MSPLNAPLQQHLQHRLSYDSTPQASCCSRSTLAYLGRRLACLRSDSLDRLILQNGRWGLVSGRHKVCGPSMRAVSCVSACPAAEGASMCLQCAESAQQQASRAAKALPGLTWRAQWAVLRQVHVHGGAVVCQRAVPPVGVALHLVKGSQRQPALTAQGCCLSERLPPPHLVDTAAQLASA